jgi:ketosteroid isomerase-like protein
MCWLLSSKASRTGKTYLRVFRGISADYSGGAFESVMVGKEAVRNSMKSYLEGNSMEAENSVGEVRLAGDWLVARGTFKETLTPVSGGDPLVVVGKWMEIDERQADGAWKISRSIWDRGHPLPGHDE